jgi:hypothetical protein
MDIKDSGKLVVNYSNYNLSDSAMFVERGRNCSMCHLESKYAVRCVMESVIFDLISAKRMEFETKSRSIIENRNPIQSM